MRKILFAFLLSAFALVGMAQTTSRDVVTLKNGSVIKGSIIEMNPAESLKIQTSEGSVFVYQMTEVASVTKEEVEEAAPKGKSGRRSSSDEDMCSVARQDCQANYNGQGSLAGATWAVTLITSPVLGLIPAAIGAATEPDISKLNVPDYKTYNSDSEYRNCYNAEAKRKKSAKAWGAYAGSSLTWLGCVLILAIL